MRIVSLIPSASEILTLLGFEGQIVGRSHECDYPEKITRLPACTSTRVDKQASSREIDDQVRTILLEALSVYDVDVELLDSLSPTHIITQSQCEACAVSLAQVEAAVRDSVRSNPRVIALEPRCLADVWRDIERVAAALGAPERGQEAVAGLNKRIEFIRKASLNARSRPRVACIAWIDPLMYAGHWIPELVTIAGGEPIWGEPGGKSDYFPIEALVEADPDVIVVMPCGFSRARSKQEMDTLVQKREWQRLSAVRSESVFVVDGNQHFNRPGPRLVESAEILAGLFQDNS